MNHLTAPGIDVGAHRAPAAFSPAMPYPPLTADALADEQRVGPLLDQLTAKELHALSRWCDRRASVTVAAELLRLLREYAATLYRDGITDTESAVIAVEFVTGPSRDGGVCWDQAALFWHADGTDTVADLSGTPLAAVLTDQSGHDRPQHGANLAVDLVTGVFVVTGPHGP